MITNLLLSISSLSRRTKIFAGVASAILVLSALCFIFFEIAASLTWMKNAAIRRPIRTTAEAIAYAEERMKYSGYAGEPKRDFLPSENELFMMLIKPTNLAEVRKSRALFYEPKAAAYDDFSEKDGCWSIGFRYRDGENRGGGNLGMQISVFKDGSFHILHDPPFLMPSFKHQIKK
ncbi:hypothetical protein KA344_16515 [bacterium]|jgi:hypothetical protein|nr:hypothetical protein [bacterium]